jgi:hypothetical protein
VDAGVGGALQGRLRSHREDEPSGSDRAVEQWRAVMTG